MNLALLSQRTQQTQLKPGFLFVLMNPAKLGKLGSRTQLTWVTCLLGSPRLAGFRTQLKTRFNLGWTQLSIPGGPIKETHNPSKIGLQNWNLGLWEKMIGLKWGIVSLNVNILRSLELQSLVPVCVKCLWLPSWKN